jgi:hypothetical protein
MVDCCNRLATEPLLQRIPPPFCARFLGVFGSENRRYAKDSDQTSAVSGHLGHDPAFRAKFAHLGVLDAPHVSGYHCRRRIAFAAASAQSAPTGDRKPRQWDLVAMTTAEMN